MEHYSRFYRNAFVIATVAVLGWVLLRMLAPLWGALGWAVVLAFLLYPAQLRLARALRHRTGLAAGILTGLTPFVILAPLSTLGVMFAHQVSLLVGYLRSNAAAGGGPALLSLQDWSDRVAQVPLLGPAWRWLQDNVPVSAQQLQASVENTAHGLLQGAAALSGVLVVGVAGSVLRFGLALFLLFFFLRDGRAMVRAVVRLIPMQNERLDRLVAEVATVLRAVVFGTLMTAVLEGIFIGIAWAVVGLPSPLVFGALAAAAAFIPAVGIAVVVVPALLYLAAGGHWGGMLFLALWTVLMALGEQLVRPLLTSRHAEVPALAVFIGAIGGVAAFGFIGFVAGPVLINLIITLVRQGGDWVQSEV